MERNADSVKANTPLKRKIVGCSRAVGEIYFLKETVSSVSFFSALRITYDPAYTRPIPYPAFETEHIPVSPCCFHSASRL